MADAPLDPDTLRRIRELIRNAIASAMRVNERGKARRTGWERAAQAAAEQLVSGLERSGFVLMRRHPLKPHDAYPRSAPAR